MSTDDQCDKQARIGLRETAKILTRASFAEIARAPDTKTSSAGACARAGLGTMAAECLARSFFYKTNHFCNKSRFQLLVLHFIRRVKDYLLYYFYSYLQVNNLAQVYYSN